MRNETVELTWSFWYQPVGDSKRVELRSGKRARQLQAWWTELNWTENIFNRNPSNIQQFTKDLYNINVVYYKLQWKHSVCNKTYYYGKNIRPVEHCLVWIVW